MTDVRAALRWIAFALRRQRDGDDLAGRVGELDDQFGELSDRELVGVADVDRSRDMAVEHRGQPDDLVGNVTEAAGLRAIAVECDRLTEERLHDQGIDDSTN